MGGSGANTTTTALEELFISCGQLSVTSKKTGGLNDTKVLYDDKAKIQVTRKDIFVGAGGNWRIPWKKVVEVTVPKNEDAEENDGVFIIVSQDHIFEALRGDDEGTNGAEWDRFTRFLQDCWNKHRKKRDKKELKRKQQEEDLAEDTKRRRNTFGGSFRPHFASPGRRGRRQTYSKRPLRSQQFLLANAHNNKWNSDDDESDDGGIFNRGDRGKKEKKNEILDDSDNEPMQDDPGTSVAVTHEPQDEEEPGFLASEADDVESGSTDPPALDDEENDSIDDNETAETPLPSSKANQGSKRRRIRKGPVQEESSDDDEELFGNGDLATTTTTTVTNSRHKVVSPEGIPEGPNTGPEQEEKQPPSSDDNLEDSPRKGTQDIKNFFSFKPKPKTNSGKNDSSKPTASVDKAPAATPLSSPSPNKRSGTPPPSAKRLETAAEEAPCTPIKAITPKKKPSVSSFFVPRRPKPVDQAKEEESPEDIILPSASTYAATPVSPHSHGNNGDEIGVHHTTPDTSPSPRKALTFSNVRPNTTLEEEDPIVDDDSSKSCSKSGMGNSLLKTPRVPRKQSLIKRRTYGSGWGRQLGEKDWSKDGTSTASMALDLKPASPSTVREKIYGTSMTERRPSPNSSQQTNKFPWRGLRNLGNTCYINASLQMIYSVPGFVSALGPVRNAGRRLVSTICDMQQALMDVSKPGAANPRNIKSAVDAKTDKFQGFQQRDAHEFLGDLLDQIHEELEGPKKESDGADSSQVEKGETDKEEDTPIMTNTDTDGEPDNTSDKETESKDMLPTDEQFLFTLQVCLKCNSCGYARTKDELYRYLSIDIVDNADGDTDAGDKGRNEKRTVEKCLHQFFRPEIREIKCEKCTEGKEALQTLRILSRPKAVLLHLKRFVLVQKPRPAADTDENRSPNQGTPAVEMTFRKNKAPVVLSPNLSLDQYLAKTECSSPAQAHPTEYSIRSIVHHIGNTANSGHYTADAIREFLDDKEKPQQWMSFDDGITMHAGNDVLTNVSKQKTAYMLLYTIGGATEEK